MTWKTKELPERFQKAVNEWNKIGTVIVYDDEDLRNFIPIKYLSFYDSLPKQIFRVDFARYWILYKYGGIYADMDTLPLKSFDDLISLNKVILCEEPVEHARKIYNKNQVICNAIMVSPPIETFWLNLVDFIMDNYNPNTDVVASTGPIAITNMYERYPSLFKDVVILDSCKLLPLVDLTNPNLTTNGFTARKQKIGPYYFDNVSNFCNLKDAYAVHLWSHEWMLKFKTKWFLYVIILLFIILLIVMKFYK
jgi:hypothetical protein